MKNTDKLYTKTDLKGRGWTDGLIARFLPVPDEMKENPHYRSGPPMKLYLPNRVAEAEASQAFQEAIAAVASRRQGAM